MLKIGIIGAGKMGRAHAGALEGVRGAKLAGVVGRNEERADKIAREHGAKAYASMEALVDAEQPDVLDICLPNALHRDCVLRAAELGKHVFCEKPIALRVEDALAMTAACRTVGVKFMVGYANARRSVAT